MFKYDKTHDVLIHCDALHWKLRFGRHVAYTLDSDEKHAQPGIIMEPLSQKNHSFLFVCLFVCFVVVVVVVCGCCCFQFKMQIHFDISWRQTTCIFLHMYCRYLWNWFRKKKQSWTQINSPWLYKIFSGEGGSMVISASEVIAFHLKWNVVISISYCWNGFVLNW